MLQTYRSSYCLARKNYDYWNNLMKKESVNLYEEGLGKDDCVAKYLVKFGVNDFEMEIQVCTSEDDVWCQAVLFDKDGNELCCSEVDDTLEGEWELSYDGDKYIVVIIPIDK